MKETPRRRGRPPLKPPPPTDEIANQLIERAQRMLEGAAALKGKDLKLQTKIKR